MTGRSIHVRKNVVIQGNVYGDHLWHLNDLDLTVTDTVHDRHECDARLCSIICQLCERLFKQRPYARIKSWRNSSLRVGIALLLFPT